MLGVGFSGDGFLGLCHRSGAPGNPPGHQGVANTRGKGGPWRGTGTEGSKGREGGKRSEKRTPREGNEEKGGLELRKMIHQAREKIKTPYGKKSVRT